MWASVSNLQFTPEIHLISLTCSSMFGVELILHRVPLGCISVTEAQ